jgi:hypothetical protein
VSAQTVNRRRLERFDGVETNNDTIDDRTRQRHKRGLKNSGRHIPDLGRAWVCVLGLGWEGGTAEAHCSNAARLQCELQLGDLQWNETWKGTHTTARGRWTPERGFCGGALACKVLHGWGSFLRVSFLGAATLDDARMLPLPFLRMLVPCFRHGLHHFHHDAAFGCHRRCTTRLHIFFLVGCWIISQCILQSS